ncbi:uncharacterized protein EV420DRAFT_1506822 [Desarmillaria tabescens]|uniref:PHD-type domain-containing protein n=1 Tax=Armillaria tabescens TaxID=1929756 RepID=A0AA39NK91_ARMTA|nr:uncharacterized protein EV420DRAFT_1506822 [Desarmillaria tabescens]KAK0467033.1 hypothetical protein EV420DRAFT_1506822 [Desarmillaria tabescens]
MIQCAECTDWYHFSCVNLTEDTAEDIALSPFYSITVGSCADILVYFSCLHLSRMY